MKNNSLVSLVLFKLLMPFIGLCCNFWDSTSDETCVLSQLERVGIAKLMIMHIVVKLKRNSSSPE